MSTKNFVPLNKKGWADLLQCFSIASVTPCFSVLQTFDKVTKKFNVDAGCQHCVWTDSHVAWVWIRKYGGQYGVSESNSGVHSHCLCGDLRASRQVTRPQRLQRDCNHEWKKKEGFYIVLNLGLLLFLTSGKGTFHTCNLEAGLAALFIWSYEALHDCVSMCAACTCALDSHKNTVCCVFKHLNGQK